MFYVKGPVQTDVHWTRPTTEAFTSWLDVFNTYIHDHQIDIHVYLVGRFITDPNDTWDIDIHLTHPNLFSFTLKQLKQIRDLMIYGMQIGHDRFKLLMDIQCILPRSKTDPTWHYPNDGNKTTDIYELIVFTDVFKEGKRIYSVLPERTITDNLFLVRRSVPTQKHRARGLPFAEPIRL